MAEQTQVKQVTTKNLKKVDSGEKLAEWNRRKREENVQMTKAQSEPKLSQYYGAGAFVAIGVSGVISY